MTGKAIAGDPRFFSRAGPHSVAAVARAAGAKWPPGDATMGEATMGDATMGDAPVTAERLLSGIAPLQTAGPCDVSFLDNRRYAAVLSATQAGAVIIHPDLAARVPKTAIALPTAEPYAGWARVCALFHPPPPVCAAIHPSAVIDPTAMIDPSSEIGPLVVIGPGASIGARCRIAAGAVIGPGVVIGTDCRIGAQVTISHALIGTGVVIFPGARIGQDGFGFAETARGFLSVPQLGRVLIEDAVEIGANTTIDRGSAQDTVIGAGSRIDNLVQIAHNVRVGRMCVIVAQVGISGSTVIEDFVMLGGQAGVAGHVTIGAKARVAGKAGVMSDVPAGAEVIGSPALPAREHWRMIATLRRLARRGARQSETKDAD